MENSSDSLQTLAIEVFGSVEAANRWFAAPALALDSRLPLDLMQTAEGAELVRILLHRINHCIDT